MHILLDVEFAINNTIFYMSIITGIFLSIGGTLSFLAYFLNKYNNLGDELPTLSDYTTGSFSSSSFGKDYGKPKSDK